MRIDTALTVNQLGPKASRLFELSGPKILALQASWDPGKGTPVFTVQGRYTTRGWTEWTQGFQFGSAVLQYEAAGDATFLEIARNKTVECMASHVSHHGVHDHGFNNVSTYGALRRLMLEGSIPRNPWELRYYEMAIMASGAVQASRWATTNCGHGYIYSFNGPQSLFVDTIRTLRVLALAHRLGHVLMGEQDEKISLLGRLVEHMKSTAKWNVFYGEGRDQYDVRGRTAHEALFNRNNGVFRCVGTQQGYSGFSTWTRGLAWAMLGFAELLEFFAALPDSELAPFGGRDAIEKTAFDAATATCDYYITNTPRDGIPYWDTGAPGLRHIPDYLGRPADPFNDFEPVDSSAAAIAAQGLLRLGHYLGAKGDPRGNHYTAAGFTVAETLMQEPYLSADPQHEGLILHSIYHRPNGWDYVPEGSKIPYGEASMWGDYHARELALYLLRLAGGNYYTFFNPI